MEETWEEKVKKLIEIYKETVVQYDDDLDDNMELDQGTYNELECERNVYLCVIRDLENMHDWNECS